MGSFSIRDILNLPEDRIRSLNTKSEEQMSFQDRNCPPRTLSSSDDQETSALETPKSSRNPFSITEIFFFDRFKGAVYRNSIKVSSTALKISRRC